MESKQQRVLNLAEKRPSITAEELTPIVLSQLQTTSKLKEESRKLRRGSRSSNNSTPASTAGDNRSGSRGSLGQAVSNSHLQIVDSGSESCGEEARLRTAEAFMSGIQSAIQSDGGQSLAGADGLSAELVGEVNSVLGRLMQSINKNDPSLIPLIVTLQTSLKATVKPTTEVDSNIREEEQERERKLKQLQGAVATKTDVALSEFSTGNDDPFFPLDSTSKIPWKIRAARKRAVKHHTTGMTKDEFAKIKQSLMQSSVNCNCLTKELLVIFLIEFLLFCFQSPRLHLKITLYKGTSQKVRSNITRLTGQANPRLKRTKTFALKMNLSSMSKSQTVNWVMLRMFVTTMSKALLKAKFPAGQGDF